MQQVAVNLPGKVVGRFIFAHLPAKAAVFALAFPIKRFHTHPRPGLTCLRPADGFYEAVNPESAVCSGKA